MLIGLAFHPEMEIWALVSMWAYCFWFPSQGILVSIQVWPKKGSKIIELVRRLSFVPNCFIFERKAKLCWAGTQKLTIRTFLWEGKALEGCRHFFSLFPGMPSSSGCPLCRQAPKKLRASSAEKDGQRASGRNPETYWLPRETDQGTTALSLTGLIWRLWAADSQPTSNLFSWWPRGCCHQEGQHLGWDLQRQPAKRAQEPQLQWQLELHIAQTPVTFPCNHQLGTWKH